METFDHINQNETSITLNWTTKNDFNYTLELDGKQENFTQQSTGSIKHVVRNLINGTEYEFKLFTVFDYARSSGKTLAAVTGKSFLL